MDLTVESVSKHTSGHRASGGHVGANGPDSPKTFSWSKVPLHRMTKGDYTQGAGTLLGAVTKGIQYKPPLEKLQPMGETTHQPVT